MSNNYFPTEYQHFIHLSRYSRWLPEKNRRETWVETVDRYFNFFDDHLKENNKFILDKKIRDELRDAVLNLEIMPSMRCLMTAGEALKRENVAGYNCLASETNVTTKEYGFVPIGSLVGKNVSVLNSDGEWSETTVETFGQQNLMKVDFSYTGYNGKETVYATSNHDWIVDGQRIQTKNLKKGMKIPFVLRQRLPVYNDIDYKLGIIHGLIYGDGTRTKYKRGGEHVTVSCERTKGYIIRLCSDQKDLLKYFEGYSVSYPKTNNGDPVIYLYDNFTKTHSLKELPAENETESYMIGFFRGWLAADGSVGKKQVTICVGSEEEHWLRKIMPKYGVYFSGSHILSSQTNFGTRKKDSRNLKIWNYSLTKDDFIIERKRNNFTPWKMERTVVGIQQTNRTEEVYCVNVPKYHNFVIERGILTGNCSYVAVDNPRSFDEILYVLMNGTGVGFSVEQKFTDQLPLVAEEFHDSETTIVVADSKLGWAKALKELIQLLYSGQIPKWDVSKVRPAGAPLKTFGGRASGPEPLVSLFQFCINVFKKASGRKLTSLECHDIVCKIAEIVVVGGVRRSALISLSDLSDDRMRVAKSGRWWEDNVQRALANNSFVAKEKIDVGVFMKEWLSLYESKSGERGIFSRVASKAQAEKFGRRDSNYEFGTNPCCFTSDMKLLTTEGWKTFAELEGTQFKIINGDGNISDGKVWKVKERRPVARIQFLNHDIDSIEATYDHIFKLADGSECQVKDLIGKKPKRYVKMRKSPDAYFEEEFHAGFMLGDGILTDLLNEDKRGVAICIGKKDYDVLKYMGGVSPNDLDKSGHLYTKYNAFLARKFNLPAKPLGSRGLPETIQTKNGLMGLFSANGCVITTSRVALKTTDHEQATNLVSALYDLFGITAYITTNKPKEQEFSNGTYSMKESFDVNIGRYADIIKFAENIGFVQKYKQEALQTLIDKRAPTVVSLTPLGEQDIYDFNEPITNWGVVNGVIVHNSEIILRSRQFCNLTEVVVRGSDDLDNIKRKIRLATILGTIQSTLTNFKYLSKKWKENCEEERLLGVSLTGIMDNQYTNGTSWGYKNDPASFTLEQTLNELRKVAVDVNAEWAKKIGIPQSTAVTCVKPSGTVSQLVDSASGIHTRHSPYYIRTVRADKKDPLAKMMVDAGFPVEDDVTKPDHTYVFSFPIKTPKGAIYRKDLSAIEQLELWLTYQNHWCEHKPSVTVTVKEEEWPEVGGWVWKHFDQMSGVSFLPYSDHIYKQAPYQDCTPEEYEELLARMPKNVDWSKLSDYEKTDQTENQQTLSCAAGGCEI